jgi:two-component system nitrogen regulation response regulator GlnG
MLLAENLDVMASCPNPPEPARRALAQLLVIGSQPALLPRQVLQEFSSASYSQRIVSTGAAGIEYLRNYTPDVIVLDLHLPDECGLEVHRQIRRINPRIPVVFVAKTKTADAAIEAMKQGAFDYLFRPLNPDELRRAVEQALDVDLRAPSPAEPTTNPSNPETDSCIFGSCPAMRDVYKSIGRVAAQNVSVLITGESGTGKELVARTLCRHGPRAKAPFLALNCAAIPEQLLESELFGHEKGAFTGADRQRTGKFEQCNGGTLLLDEVGDMPLVLQTKILRVLQEQAFQRVGGSETVHTDVRIIAATHGDLKSLAAQERFRADLYYRLSVFTIHLPPLRERGEDLPMLVRLYLRRFSRELGREVRDIAPEAMDRLQNYAWPGNIRELQSVLKQALLRASGTVLLPAFLPQLQRLPESCGRPGMVGEALDEFINERLTPHASALYAQTHAEVDHRLLSLVLQYTNGNQRQAARMLGIARQTLRQRLLELGLQVRHGVEVDVDAVAH